MQIKRIQIKNFRCFQEQTLEFNNPLVLITGQNGSGKSSILEALHYGCYLRSFRTHLPREMIQFEQDNLFVKIDLEGHEHGLPMPMTHTVQVGFSQNKRSVKVDQKAIRSYKELTDFYRIITITEDDLTIIKGSPEVRRLFIDQALSLQNPEYIGLVRRYRQIVQNRNALLSKGPFRQGSYNVWTEQLWEQAQRIQHERRTLLKSLEKRINELLATWFGQDISIAFEYRPKKIKEGADFEDFCKELPGFQDQELRFGRSLFGAHLDDIMIRFCRKASRIYASRGQQKLMAILLKVAQMQEILAHKGDAILLLDDFMTDFDPIKGEILVNLLCELSCQIIFTSPNQKGFFDKKLLKDKGAQHIQLTD